MFFRQHGKNAGVVRLVLKREELIELHSRLNTIPCKPEDPHYSAFIKIRQAYERVQSDN